jgi:protein-tyrosine-phosphatase
MLIHFICTGNSYRSRLAEAYLNAQAVPGLTAMSSGIHAQRNEHGPITWYAARIIKHHQLVPFMSLCWKQTDAASLEAADELVFMAEEHRAYCQEHFVLAKRPFRVWDVPDVDPLLIPESAAASERETILVRETERTFERITKLVDELIAQLRSPQEHAR